MDQRIIELYDEYTHAPLPRRVFLDRLTRLAGGTAAALALLPFLESDKAAAAVVASDDVRLEATRLSYPGKGGAVQAYQVRPKNAGKLPGVVVIHQNRGLNPHIEDVARRIALESFVVLAPDALSPLGGTPADDDKAREMFTRLDRGQAVADLVAAVSWLDESSRSTGKIGVVGFCWGGGMANQVAVHSPDLDAAVVYYGPVPNPADVPKIKAPLLLHYAGLDKRVNAGVPGYEAALKASGKSYTKYVYEGANHAFNDDTAGARYNRAAAELAWGRTIAFLRKQLS